MHEVVSNTRDFTPQTEREDATTTKCHSRRKLIIEGFFNEVRIPFQVSTLERQSYLECRQDFDVRICDEVSVEVDGCLQFPAVVGDAGVDLGQVVEQRDDLLPWSISGDAELVTRPKELVPEVGRLLLVLFLPFVAVLLKLCQFGDLLLEAWKSRAELLCTNSHEGNIGWAN